MSANYADGSDDFTPLLKAAAFVHLVVGIVSYLEITIRNGAEESPAKSKHSSLPKHGSESVRIYGSEIDELARDAEMFTAVLNACLRSITSPDGGSAQNFDLSIRTSSCCALAAIVSFIPEKIKKETFYVVRIEIQYPDHTLIPWAGSKRRGQDLVDQRAYLAASGYAPAEVEALVHCPDGPRYKAVGNSKAIPVVRWIGKRIQDVETCMNKI